MKKLWLRQERALVLLAVCGGIFGSCFALYHLPLRAVAYPCALCALVLLGAGIGEFCAQRQKRKKLAALASLPDDLTERLSRCRHVRRLYKRAHSDYQPTNALQADT